MTSDGETGAGVGVHGARHPDAPAAARAVLTAGPVAPATQTSLFISFFVNAHLN